MFWRFLYVLLRRFADYASNAVIDDLRRENAALKSQLTVEKGENQRWALMHSTFCEAQKAQAAIHQNQRVIAEASAMRTE